ncbi:conjugative transfer protein TraD [Legionella santicrucis]|uniref:Conjugative transfer protein TraD n=1 Tax=Legionella santicrucis TaxID=45074 RepID=A0A0W0ZBH2_9GAMM|nr:type IV conjugative transfer system coupling protein TraD [Legionella santicrucis]KTD66480.1 conjugative transfer protein TraD [Legionella santicrucis]
MSQDKTSKQFTRGGQTTSHDWRMFVQITKLLICVYLTFVCLFTVGGVWKETSLEKIRNTGTFYYARFLADLGGASKLNISVQGKVYPLPVKTIAMNPYIRDVAASLRQSIYDSFIRALFISFFLSVLVVFYFIKRGKEQKDNQFIRGSRIESSEEVKKEIVAKKCNSDIRIDGFPMIKGSEVQHYLIHGTVGTGKSQLIMKFLDALRARGDRVIVYDKGCTLIPHYYRPNLDVILNPYDARCPYWDMWLEAPNDSDFENMAQSLIPMQGESDPFWVNAARTVFSCCSSKMRSDPDRSPEKLLKLTVTGEFSHLEDYLKGTAAATLVSGKIEKTAISIRSVLTTYLKSLLTLSGLTGKDNHFSIRDYILNQDNNGWLFISSNGEQHNTLKPLMSMWLAQASLTLLSLEPDRNRRIWFICDELPTLHKLPHLGETIAEVRKFGGCFLLGMQSHSQLTQIYGQSGGAKAIFDLLNTRFFFRSPSSDMARLAATELGEEDIEESRENYSYGANSIRDGVSLGRQRVSRQIVAYPQIQELDDMKCYLRLPGSYPVTQLGLKLQERASEAEGFIQRVVPGVAQTQEDPSGATETQDSEASSSLHAIKNGVREVEFEV